MTMSKPISWALALLLGTTLAQAQQRTSSAQVATPKPVANMEPAELEPVILARSSLDEKVVALRVAPRIATSIRLPEPSTRSWWETPRIFRRSTLSVNQNLSR